jgi:hypothetical protein
VASRVPRLVGIESWNAIDAHELRAGSQIIKTATSAIIITPTAFEYRNDASTWSDG